MRIINFSKNGTPTLGVRRKDQIVDLSIAAPSLPRDLRGLLEAGDKAMAEAQHAAEAAGDDALVAADGLTYLPPIENADKYLCIGLNYVDHAEETNSPIPEYPIVFVRMRNSLAAHNQPMECAKATSQYDYEAELAVIVGKRTPRHVPKADALSYVAGYSCFNDGSLRDYQFKSPQWTMGKSADATGGFGPEFVSADELPPGGAPLAIKCRLNGETMQDSNTDKMIFDTATLISTLSELMTLEPGDVIITGTPPGVGAARDPQVFMKGGDVCEIEIEGIGTLVNPIVDEA